MTATKIMMSGMIALMIGTVTYAGDAVLYDGKLKEAKKITIKAIEDPDNPANMVGDFSRGALGKILSIVLANTDLSNYKALSFRLYARNADGASLMLALTSDPEGKRGNYYYKKIKIDWDGWKTFTIPFDKLGVSRKPVGFNFITTINFHSRGWGIKPVATAKFLIDDIKLLAK